MKRSPGSRKIDEPLLLVWLLSMVFGMLLIYSASSIIAESNFGGHLYFLKNQAIWAVISLAAAALVVRIDLERWALYAVPALFLVMLMLLAVFAMPAVNEAHRWLRIGPLSVQPSEFFKLLTIVYLAYSLSNPTRNIGEWKQLVFPYLPFLGSGLLMILLQPNLGMVIVIGTTLLGIFFLAGVRMKHIVLTATPLAAVAYLVVFVIGYKRARVDSFIESVVDPLAGGYQIKQAALALGSGQFFGSGIGDGLQKLFYLPYPHTDFIFASSGEEIGFAGLVCLVALLIILLYRGCRIAAAQPDRFGYLLAAGLTWSLFVSIAVNLAMVTSLVPVMGIALPFFSYGGSSLLVSSITVALLLNLSRRVAR